MSVDDDIGRRVHAAHLAQSLSGPAQTVLGYLELLVEDAREAGHCEAAADLETAMRAARDLSGLIERMLAHGADARDDSPETEARLRHDLRNPLNAILGYCEMVAEDFPDVLPAPFLADLAAVMRESRALLGRIDLIVDASRASAPMEAAPGAEMAMAADLARTMATQPDAPPGEAGRILVIDDIGANRALLARRLARDNHRVTTAASARAALEILETQEFDLALVDILMPDMNGIELLALLKADPRWREITVVMVSGLREDEAVIRCIAAGAEDYLPKPVDPVLLRARIAACLERRRWREREKRYLARIEFEKARADALLNAILPGKIVARLAGGETVIADRFDDVSILFADIVGFTPLAARTPPGELLRRLGALFSCFDEIADRHGIEKIKTIGDAYMAAAGLPEPRDDHARTAVAFARALIGEMARADGPGAPLSLRIGIHSGPVVAGLIGRKRFVYDVWGHTVNFASRLESAGAPGRIQISQSTLDALGHGVEVSHQGMLDLKGIGVVPTYMLAL